MTAEERIAALTAENTDLRSRLVALTDANDRLTALWLAALAREAERTGRDLGELVAEAKRGMEGE